MPTKYEFHIARYREHGCGADICSGAKKRVFCRGSIPADVLFLGEGPGLSEDITGRPFCGPAGKVLDQIIEASVEAENEVRVLDSLPKLRYCITNLVCCVPKGEDNRKVGEPSPEDIQACSVRLLEFVEMVQPKLLVCVGNLARDWTDPKYLGNIGIPRSIKRVDILHPAYILRQSGVQKGLLVQRCIVRIEEALQELRESKVLESSKLRRNVGQ